MKVLIVGLGSIAKRHLAALQILQPDVEVFALRSQPDASNWEGVKNVYDLEAVIGQKFDFAIISNPTSEHKRTITELLRLHCPLFIEKPLHASLDVEEVLPLVESLSIPTYIACNLRFLGCIQYLHSALLQTPQRVQEVNVYCGSYLPDWRPGQDFRQTYSAQASLGGGVHIDLIHEFDYLYWLFGMPRQTHRLLRSSSSLDISSVDYANYTLEYPGFVANVVLNYYRRDAKRTLELVLENETWLVDLRANRVTCGEKVLYASEESIADTYLAQMKHFLAVIAGQESSLNPIQEAFDVLKICLEK